MRAAGCVERNFPVQTTWVGTSSCSSVCKPLKSLEIWTSTLIIKVSRTGVVV